MGKGNMTPSQGIGRSPGVERPYIEVAQQLRIFFLAYCRKILTHLFFTYEETALVASHYIEGHALFCYCLTQLGKL